jgi:hypothetical protein
MITQKTDLFSQAVDPLLNTSVEKLALNNADFIRSHAIHQRLHEAGVDFDVVVKVQNEPSVSLVKSNIEPCSVIFRYWKLRVWNRPESIS